MCPKPSGEGFECVTIKWDFFLRISKFGSCQLLWPIMRAKWEFLAQAALEDEIYIFLSIFVFFFLSSSEINQINVNSWDVRCTCRTFIYVCHHDASVFRISYFLTQINAPFSDPKINRAELRAYSRVHISSDEVFSKILKKPSIVQK